MGLPGSQFIRRTGPMRIDAYRSFGSPSVATFRGRVLAGPGPGRAVEGEGRGARLLRTAVRFLSREVAGIEVVVTVDRTSVSGTTDGEGYFEVDVPLSPVTQKRGRVSGHVRVANRKRTWTIEALVIDPLTPRIVISDVDDTLLVNGTGAIIPTVLATVSGSVLTRQPIAGTPDLYRWLSADGTVPFFYVSSSPWNLYDFLDGFLHHHRYPVGPLLLRDFGLNKATLAGGHGSHKVGSIVEILALCPSAEVVLLGDSSQEDAAAFAEVMTQFPERTLIACITDVGDPVRARRTMGIAETVGGNHYMALFESAEEIRAELDRLLN